MGETVEEITAEKCGIIKNSIPNTTINTKSNIVEVIDKFSTKQNTKTNYINKDLINIAEHKTNKLRLNYYDSSYILPQAGSFQAENAVLAIETIKNEFKILRIFKFKMVWINGFGQVECNKWQKYIL